MLKFSLKIRLGMLINVMPIKNMYHLSYRPAVKEHTTLNRIYD